MSDSKGLLRSAGSISLATLVSRVLGLARDQVQSYVFGASAVTDAFAAAFRIPNLLRDLFAEGALSSAFVPTFTRRREEAGPEAAWQLVNRVLTALVVVLGIVTIAFFVGAPLLAKLYAPGFEPAKSELTATMTRILSPFLLLVALAAVAMGALNVCGRFFLPALAPAWFNVCAILGIVLLTPLFRRLGWPPALSLAVGALAGGAAQFLVQIRPLRREGYRPRLDWAPKDPGLRRIGALMTPAIFGLAATQLSILIDTVLASRFGDGPITCLQLAFRLMQLPIGLFGVAIATANLARVSKDAAKGDLEALSANLAGALRMAALLALPATAGLVALREPIVRLLFEHGRFDARSTSLTALATLCYALGLYAYTATKIQVPTFYALGDTRTPVRASATALTVKIAANFALIPVFQRLDIPPFSALAVTTSLAAWTNFALLSRGLDRRLGRSSRRGVGLATAKVAGVAAAMGVAVALLHRLLETLVPGGGHLGDAARLAPCVVVGIAMVLVAAPSLGIPEVRALRERLRGLAGRDRRG